MADFEQHDMTAMPPRQQPALYHDLMTPAECLEIRSEVRSFCDRYLAPVAWEIGHREESVEAFPRDLFGRMAAAGLFRIPFGAEVGGRGLKHPATATAIVIEELSYYSNSVAAIFDVHCILAGHALECAGPELQQQYLKPLLDGSVIGSFATSEPNASTDLSVGALVTEATFHEDHIEVSGHKRWITNSPVAGFVVLLCRDGGRMSLIVVDLDAPGVTVGAPDKKLGNHGQLTADILFDKVRVPTGNVIGNRGEGLKIALQVLTYGRIGIAATGVGMAQATFDHCVERLKTRRAFGKAMAEFQHWQFRLAERATEIENARNLYLKAALRMDSGQSFPEPEAAMAKWYATNLAGEFARDGVQIFGGYGFTKNSATTDRTTASKKSIAIAKSPKFMKARTKSRNGSSPAQSSEKNLPADQIGRPDHFVKWNAAINLIEQFRHNPTCLPIDIRSAPPREMVRHSDRSSIERNSREI